MYTNGCVSGDITVENCMKVVVICSNPILFSMFSLLSKKIVNNFILSTMSPVYSN